MKKVVLLALIVLLSAGSAMATVSVNWITFSTITDPDTATPVADGSVALLIWAPDGVIDPLDPFNPLTPSNDDVVLVQSATAFNGFITDGAVNVDASLNLPINLGAPYAGSEDAEIDGSPFGDWNETPPVTGGDATIYTRVFNSAAPGDGTWYDDAALPTLLDQDPPGGASPGPQTLDITGGTPYLLTQQMVVIPEPATLAFLGIGLLSVLTWRRRR